MRNMERRVASLSSTGRHNMNCSSFLIVGTSNDADDYNNNSYNDDDDDITTTMTQQ